MLSVPRFDGPPIRPPLDGLAGITGAWSMSRPLLTSWGAAALYTTGTGISAIKDQSGAGQDFAQATGSLQPVASIAGPQVRACATFDGSDDVLATAGALSAFISNTTGYLIVSFYITTLEAFTLIFGDAEENVALNTNTTSTLNIQNYDGTVDEAVVSVAISTPYVAEWRHEAGNVYGRLNGGAWSAAVASGNTADMTKLLRLGKSDFSNTLTGSVFEAAIFSTIPPAADQDRIAANMLAWVGR